MLFNQYSIYTRLSNANDEDSKQLNKVLAKLETLRTFDAAKDVKEWLYSNWKLKDDIALFAIAPNVYLNTITSEKYFNVTIRFEDKIQSFNYANY